VVEGQLQLRDPADSELAIDQPRLINDSADAEDLLSGWLMIAAEPSTPKTP
jgi:hypothetical protein